MDDLKCRSMKQCVRDIWQIATKSKPLHMKCLVLVAIGSHLITISVWGVRWLESLEEHGSFHDIIKPDLSLLGFLEFYKFPYLRHLRLSIWLLAPRNIFLNISRIRLLPLIITESKPPLSFSRVICNDHLTGLPMSAFSGLQSILEKAEGS